MAKLNHLLATGLVGLFAAAFPADGGQGHDVRDYGAKPDGKTLCTQPIQQAIDRCAADGGGTVLLPAGTFLRGTIFMKMQHYLACQRLTVRGIRVSSHVSYNNDGLDVDGCRDVCISDCMIDSDDDALFQTANHRIDKP